MARLNINPTRMELKRVRARLKTAVRGHKLLKDKSDEMVRQFSALIKYNKLLREEVEEKLSGALQEFTLAKSITDAKVLEEAIMMPAHSLTVKAGYKNVLNIKSPKLDIETSGGSVNIPYSFMSVSGEFDAAIVTIDNLLEKMLKLSEVEKTCNMLSADIQKTKRRVNALEFVLIPQMEETIKFITMKLEENERSNLIRIMKVKTMINNR